MNEETRQCKKCGEVKTLRKFKHFQLTPVRIYHWCDACVKQYWKDEKSRKNHGKYVKWKERNPKKYKQKCERKKQWAKANPDKKKLQNQRYYDKHRRSQRQIQRLRVLRDLKVNGCAICGYNDCITALVFHHVDRRDKAFCINMRTMTDKQDELIIEELNKCILLCMNCHAEIHFKELDREV
ncbi:MAG: hypothetical protein R6U65_07265 [Perlabentimonas sp.]